MKLQSKLKSNLRNLGFKELVFFLSVVLISGATGFYAFNTQTSSVSTVNFDLEINSSHNSADIDFFNETLEIDMEEGSETRFYIDRPNSGTSGEELSNLKRDGKIRSTEQILDYSSGVYILHYSYHLDSENSWLKPEKIVKLD